MAVAERRAVVFDLDDTLYPYRAFVESGFAAVAAVVARDHGVPPEVTRRVLRRARRDGHRGRELQRLCAVCFLPVESAVSLRDVLVEHRPRLRLPRASRQVLEALRAEWRIGILTNGRPDVQARKVAALGLAPLVDAVVFAAEYGDGTGKPKPDGFAAVLDRLQVPPGAAVFVGNDPAADIAGAAASGLRTIHVPRRPEDAAGEVTADARAARLSSVPVLAGQLLARKEMAYAV